MRGNGILFSDGQLASSVAQSKDSKYQHNIDKVKASNLIIFTCANGNVNAALAERMNGEMLTISDVKDGFTTVGASANAAYAAAETLIKGGDMETASLAAQVEINKYSDEEYEGKKVNEGDKILYQDLRKKESK